MVLGIYGASGLGREVYIIAKKINQIENKWSEIVYIDDNEEIKEVQNVKVYTFDMFQQQFDNAEITIAVGEPAIREILFNKVKDNHMNLAALIHPGVYIDESTYVGEGTVICEGVTITSNVKIGNNSYIHPHAVIGHDIIIGNHAMIGANCVVGGADVIGDRVYMGLLSGTIQGLKIGNDAIISAGAIVFRNIEDNDIVVGNPARVMKKNENKRVFSK